LPPAAEGIEAIEEYEAMKSSQPAAEEDDDDNGAPEKPKPLWVKGQSSIYMDAFNLALDTVLEEESHLFDEKENDVFKQWRALEYEAQYLYVLFLNA
jgi:Fanconi-associated nuclease 1